MSLANKLVVQWMLNTDITVNAVDDASWYNGFPHRAKCHHVLAIASYELCLTYTTYLYMQEHNKLLLYQCTQ